MKKSRDEVIVGAFAILGFVILSLVVFFVSGVSLVRQGYRLDVMFNYVSILDKGAPVRMAGVRVGEVNKVALVEDKETGKTRVLVQLFIAKGFEIRENYLFNVRGTHILSEPHIEITPQPGRAAYLKDGDTSQGVDPVPVEVLVDRADQIADHLEAMLGRLRKALEDKETEQDVRETIKNLATLTRSLNQMMSGSENDMKNSLKNLNTSTQSLEEILNKVHQGQGTLGKLLMEDDLYKDLQDFVREIKTHPWRLLHKDDGKKDKKWVPFV